MKVKAMCRIACGLLCISLSIFAVSCRSKTVNKAIIDILWILIFDIPKDDGTTEKTTLIIAKPKHINLDEFKSLFAADKLDNLNRYYYGYKDGFIYLSIDEVRARNEYEQIHTITTYIVPEDTIKFEPRINFDSYERGTDRKSVV